MMMDVVNIQTQRLVLRKFTKKDAGDLMHYQSNPEYHKYLPSTPKNSVKEYEKIIKEYTKHYKSKLPTLFWAIELKEEHKVVGFLSVEKLSTNNKFAQIGWGVGKDYEGKGIAFEAAKALINHIFNSLDVHRIEAVVWQGNTRSKNLALRLGFKQDGTLREARIKNGKFLDLWQFGLLKQDWQQNPIYKD